MKKNILKFKKKPTKTMQYLYGAYGSNMNLIQMSYRCPNAKPVGSVFVNGFTLKFRGVADIEHSKDATVPLALWKITDACEQRLDIYEGYPNLYRKQVITIPSLKEKFGTDKVMVYIMNSKDVYPPSSRYLEGIAQGYNDFGIDTDTLMYAVKDSYSHTNI